MLIPINKLRLLDFISQISFKFKFCFIIIACKWRFLASKTIAVPFIALIRYILTTNRPFISPLSKHGA